MRRDEISTRLNQLDGLRGLAALLVVAFHYTTRYDQRFAHAQPLWAEVSWGSIGVELFFVISGFVIFMTLDRSRTPSDFAVSRLIRLFPTYWVAMSVTWLVTTGLAVPGTTSSFRDLLLNVTMLGGALGARSIDGAYWSLEIELYFYAWMLLVAAMSLPQRGLIWLQAWLLAASLTALSARLEGPQLPYVVQQISLMNWIGWFALGVVAYLWKRDGLLGREKLATIALALLAIGLRDSLAMAVFAAACFGAVAAAGQNRLRGADSRVLVFLGGVSYPLYLVHQEVGMALIVRLQRDGYAPMTSIAVAFGVTVALAFVLHHAVELPAMRMLRGAWKRRSAARSHVVAPSKRAQRAAAVQWPFTAFAVALLLMSFAAVSHLALARDRSARELALASMPPLNAMPAAAPAVTCADGPRQPLVLLVLGQSNAASQALADSPSAPVRVLDGGRCRLVADPLPSTSGQGASVWSALAVDLDRRLPMHAPVLAPLAIGGTVIQQWTEPGPVRDTFLAFLRSVRDGGVKPTFVAWQQGEADMREGTEARRYAAALATLRRDLDAHGIHEPLLVARSTYCRQVGSGAVGRAIDRRIVHDPLDRVWPGPDTDRFGNTHRYDNCHFNELGRAAAASAWADTIVAALAHHRTRRDAPASSN